MRQIDLTKIVISSNGRNIYYDGKPLDKCAISSLIHDIACKPYPLWSDIYWYSATKKELVDYLITFIS